MTSAGRLRRVFKRGDTSQGLWAKRNRKAEKYFDKWWSGVMVRPYQYETGGRTYWELVPTGRGLIHKGRKP